MTETQAVDWEGRYRGGAVAWERHGLHPMFVEWRESGALAPCRILFPGAGRSLEPLALAGSGFAVTVVDIAESAIAVQRARLGRLGVNARVEHEDLFAWEGGPFDAIYDQNCLCALPPALRLNYVRRLHRWLRPGGALFVLFMQSADGGGPPFHCDMSAMRRMFAAPDWTWPDALPPLVAHPAGKLEQPAMLRRN